MFDGNELILSFLVITVTQKHFLRYDKIYHIISRYIPYNSIRSHLVLEERSEIKFEVDVDVDVEVCMYLCM